MATPMVRQILAQGARKSLPPVAAALGRGVSTAQRPPPQKEQEEIPKNPYLDRYADKIKKAQSVDPDKFQSKMEELQNSKSEKKWHDERKADIKPTKSAEPQPKLLRPLRDKSSRQGLESVMRLDLIQDLSTEDIHKIWTQYHAKKDCISAVIPSPAYDKIYQTAKENPVFLYPLPKKTGYEFYFGQFDTDHSCFFTSLINYQAYQENAPILLSINHFTELQKEKGIVLMRGEMDTNTMSVQDAQFLANQLQLYYATDNPDRLGLLRTFNHDQDQFKHMDVIAMLEKTTFELPTAQTPEGKDSSQNP